MPKTTNQYHHNIWFLQITLNQKAKEQVALLLEDNTSFENTLKFLSSNFCQYKDIIHTYEIYLKNTHLSQQQILTKNDTEQLCSKSLSFHAPLALEYRGNPLVLSKKLIGIVGSRHPTFYGRLQAQKFARELSKMGYGIVSGGAIGIDAIANLHSLEGDHGASICVIGNGIDCPYPPSNQKLFHKLSHSNNGLLLSEFSSNDRPQKWYFPQRNATIAELCDFLLVIEATLTSGSLMTAKFAAQCGKPVGALPGSVDNPNTVGSHMLIQNGAACIHEPLDILKFL